MKTIYIILEGSKIAVNAKSKDAKLKRHNDLVAEQIIALLYDNGLITRMEMEKTKE